jgi:hypothetical protein
MTVSGFVADWLRKVETEWPRLSVESRRKGVSEIRLGEGVFMSGEVTLNSVSPDEIKVQVLSDRVVPDDLKDDVVFHTRSLKRDAVETDPFQPILEPSARRGLHGYAIRLWPEDADSINPFPPGPIQWAQALLPVAGLHAR